MENQPNTMQAYRQWALDNPTQANPRLYAVYTELGYRARSRGSASVPFTSQEIGEIVGISDPKLVLKTIDTLSEIGLIRWKYRSCNKKQHEVALEFFSRPAPKQYPDQHPSNTPTNTQAIPDVTPNDPLACERKVLGSHGCAELVVSSYLKEEGGGGSIGETGQVNFGTPPPPPEEIPDFVKQHREQAAVFAQELRDRHPPIDNEIAAIDNEWCRVGSTPYTKSSFEDWLTNFYTDLDRANLFQKNTGYTVSELIIPFVEKRCNLESFANKRQLSNYFEIFARDFRAGRYADFAPPAPQTGPKPKEFDYTGYKLELDYEE